MILVGAMGTTYKDHTDKPLADLNLDYHKISDVTLTLTHNNKLATYHSWFAIPFSRNERMPINVPRYLHLDLSKHACYAQ